MYILRTTAHSLLFFVFLIVVVFSKNLNVVPKVLLVLLYAGLLLAWMKNSPRIKLERTSVVLLIVSLAWVAHSLIHIAFYPINSIQELSDSFFIIFAPVFVFIFVILTNEAKVRDSIKTGSSYALYFFLFDTLFYYVFDYSFYGQLIGVQSGGRFSSFLENAHLGSYVFSIYLINLVYGNVTFRLREYFSTIVIILATESRLVLVFMVLIFLSFFARWLHVAYNKKVFDMKHVLLFFLLIFFGVEFSARYDVLYLGIDSILSNQADRIREYQTVWQIFSDNIFGVSQSFYLDNKFLYGDGELDHPHSYFFELVLYKGVFGVLLLLAYYLFIVRCFFKRGIHYAAVAFCCLPVIGQGNFANTGHFLLILLAISGVVLLSNGGEQHNKETRYEF